MLIQLKLEPKVFWISAIGIAAGVLLLPVIWNKKRAAGFLRDQMESNQEFDKKSSEE
jgi:hypothetical protein